MTALRRTTLGALRTWEQGDPEVGRLPFDALDAKGDDVLDKGDVVTVERAAEGGHVKVCDFRGRPLAVALAVTAVDVLPDHSPKEARAIALQVGLNRVFEHADQAAVALRDIEEMDRFAPHAPHRTARERLLAACAEYLETATGGEA